MQILFENSDSNGDHDYRLIVKNVQHRDVERFCIEIEGVRRQSMSYILRDSDIIELHRVLGSILSQTSIYAGNNQPTIELPQ